MRSLLGLRAVGMLGAAALALGFACCAASAEADSIGLVMKGPDTTSTNDRIPWAVQATLSGNTVTITNPESNAELASNTNDGDPGIITSVDLNGPGGYTGNGGNGGNGAVANGSFTANQPFTVNSASPINGCDIIDSINVDCVFADPNSNDTSQGIQPGQSATITYPTNAPGVLASVSLNFDFDNLYLYCRPSNFGSDLRFQSNFTAVGSSAANNCLPPAKVRITAMHINTRKHTASFRQTAKHATGFGCILKRNNEVVSDHNCGAKEVYRRLPSGRYIYEVWAVNKSGVSGDFAVAHFTIR
jgi:hypothetical protein